MEDTKAKSFNRKIFPVYKMFSWDLLFYYSVSFLFLTQVKGFSASDVLLFDAFYTVFKFIAQIPSINITESIGKRKSLIVANLLVAISILVLILCKDMWHLVVSAAFMGFGYSLKTLVDSVFLRDQITTKEHPGTAFTNLDGTGNALWYGFDAASSIACGFLFVFSNYLPMFLCFGMCIISFILACMFKPYEDPSKKEKLEESGSYVQYFKDLRVAFKNIFRSKRLKALFLFSGMFAAILALRSTVASSLFTEIGVKEEYFGIIFAGLTMFSAIASKCQNFFHKALKNRVLTYFSMIFSLSLVGIGLTAIFCKNFGVCLTIILIFYAMQYIIKGPYYTLIKRYLNSFSSPTMATKIFSVNTLVESLFSSVMCYLGSLLLDVTSTTYAITILGCVFVLAFVFILDYMRDKIGLKPEEYDKKDINFTEVH